MGDFIGSYVTIDDEDVLSRQFALLRAEIPVSIVEMDRIQDENDRLRRLQAVDALGSQTPVHNRANPFQVEDAELDDISVEPMSLFAPKSGDDECEHKLFSIDLKSTKKVFKQIEMKTEEKVSHAQNQKKITIKSSLIKFLWRKKNDEKVDK